MAKQCRIARTHAALLVAVVVLLTHRLQSLDAGLHYLVGGGASQSQCGSQPTLADTDLQGGDIAVVDAMSGADCCQMCHDHRLRSDKKQCKAWTFEEGFFIGTCHLKGQKAGSAVHRRGTVSGYMGLRTGTCAASAAERQFIAEVIGNATARRAHRVETEPAVRAAAAAAERWGHTDLVLVTAWGRPEFLLGTLQKLAAAVAVEQHHFVFLLDDEYDDRVGCIVEAWPRFRGKTVVRTPRHDWMALGSWGNTSRRRDFHFC